MSLEIKKAHLQYVFTLLAMPLPPPQFFYANADIIYCFLKRMDEKTTYRIIKQTGNPEIKPSYFGELIIFTAENWVDINASPRASPTEIKLLKLFWEDTFLNIMAWYICPLLEANRRMCPYMPRPWLEEYLQKTNDLKQNNAPKYQEHLNNILDFMRNVGEKWWLYPYEKILSQVGEIAQTNTLNFISMFLRAYEEQKGGNIKRTYPKLSSEIIEFLDNIEEIDELNPPLSI